MEEYDNAEWRIHYDEIEFGEMIGKGTFGLVCEGTWKGINVALKTVHIQLDIGGKNFANNKKWREFTVWQQLKYPHVVHLYGVAFRKQKGAIPDWEITFVMQKCEVSLCELLNMFPYLSIDHRIKYTYETALAMRHIHSKHILHRDLKCMNILLLDDVAKICDFGTSRVCEQNSFGLDIAGTRDYVGSPSHMPPEIWEKMPATRKSDVWSFGMCFYHIISGVPPFDGMDLFQLYTALIKQHKRPKWPNMDIPKWVIKLVAKCWSVKADKRPEFDDICKTIESNCPHVLEANIDTLGSTHRRSGDVSISEEESKENCVESSPASPICEYSQLCKNVSLEDRFVGSTVLSGIGNTIGFYNEKWESMRDGAAIHKECQKLGGVLSLDLTKMKASSDMYMSMATARACVSESGLQEMKGTSRDDLDQIMEAFCEEYVRCLSTMPRCPIGLTTSVAVKRLGWRKDSKKAVSELRKNGCRWHETPYSTKGGGCGATSRSSPIGLRFSGPHRLDNLIAVALEAGRLTHNHPTGFLGSLTSAIFTAFAIDNVAVHTWGHLLINNIIPRALRYLKEQKKDWDNIRIHSTHFVVAWKRYLKQRDLEGGVGSARFSDEYGVKTRDIFYRTYSFSGTGGASGHDCVIIAYDALLAALQEGQSDAEKIWETLSLHSFLHGGDNDSTGIIAAAWFGALFGLQGVPNSYLETFKDAGALSEFGRQLYKAGRVEDVEIKVG